MMKRVTAPPVIELLTVGKQHCTDSVMENTWTSINVSVAF